MMSARGFNIPGPWHLKEEDREQWMIENYGYSKPSFVYEVEDPLRGPLDPLHNNEDLFQEDREGHKFVGNLEETTNARNWSIRNADGTEVPSHRINYAHMKTWTDEDDAWLYRENTEDTHKFVGNLETAREEYMRNQYPADFEPLYAEETSHKIQYAHMKTRTDEDDAWLNREMPEDPDFSESEIEESDVVSQKQKPKRRSKKSSTVTTDSSDPLNAPTPDYIDTKPLCGTVWSILKEYGISQTLFAQVVAQRRQGTMSDLLRNPRDWFKMKSGRDVYRRMYNWVRMAAHERLEILNRDTPPVEPRRKKLTDGRSKRHTFKPEEKAMLQAVFARNERPDEDEMYEIAKQLDVKYDIIRIYFTNARRRKSNVPSRIQ
ncbi:hypothetical protein CRE_18178 [Caenorhabditis remanei]|uniref:One cut domain family member n=1 Tax=Caenorhabditis remanei TaxID=31234 RepID=E3N8K1_CAERE|nr:hypothetical protein CRE_18178 [Caenorhabditis remanei]